MITLDNLAPYHEFSERKAYRDTDAAYRYVSCLKWVGPLGRQYTAEAGLSTGDHRGFCGGVIWQRSYLRCVAGEGWEHMATQALPSGRYVGLPKYDTMADAGLLYPDADTTTMPGIMLTSVITSVVYHAAVVARTRNKGQVLWTDQYMGAFATMFDIISQSRKFERMFPFEIEFDKGDMFTNPNTHNICVTQRIIMGEQRGVIKSTSTTPEALRAKNALSKAKLQYVSTRCTVEREFLNNTGDNAYA